jgi:hypothetical protein
MVAEVHNKTEVETLFEIAENLQTDLVGKKEGRNKVYPTWVIPENLELDTLGNDLDRLYNEEEELEGERKRLEELKDNVDNKSELESELQNVNDELKNVADKINAIVRPNIIDDKGFDLRVIKRKEEIRAQMPDRDRIIAEKREEIWRKIDELRKAIVDKELLDINSILKDDKLKEFKIEAGFLNLEKIGQQAELIKPEDLLVALELLSAELDDNEDIKILQMIESIEGLINDLNSYSVKKAEELQVILEVPEKDESKEEELEVEPQPYDYDDREVCGKVGEFVEFLAKNPVAFHCFQNDLPLSSSNDAMMEFQIYQDDVKNSDHKDGNMTECFGFGRTVTNRQYNGEFYEAHHVRLGALNPDFTKLIYQYHDLIVQEVGKKMNSIPGLRGDYTKYCQKYNESFEEYKDENFYIPSELTEMRSVSNVIDNAQKDLEPSKQSPLAPQR